jgi:alpha-tubulin suppressor-like RCC1 family protein
MCNGSSSKLHNIFAKERKLLRNILFLFICNLLLCGILFPQKVEAVTLTFEQAKEYAKLINGYGFALKADKNVVTWDSSGKETTVPEWAQGNVVAIGTSGGTYFTVKTDGSVSGWGGSYYDVPQAAYGDIVDFGIAHNMVGEKRCFALKNDGSVVTWPGNIGNMGLTSSAKIVSMKGNLIQDMYLYADGTVSAKSINENWGRSLVSVPADVQGDVKSIAIGLRHFLVLKESGRVMAFGSYWHDQGMHNKGQCVVPAQAQSGVVAIAGSDAYSMALKANGTVLAWGQYSQVPNSIQGKTLAISASGSSCMALQEDGSVVAWNITNGSLLPVPAGLNLFEGEPVEPEQPEEPGGDIPNITWPLTVEQVQAYTKKIDLDIAHCLALKANGQVVAWGLNDYGQCDVPTGGQSGVTFVDAGRDYSLAIKDYGGVISWGHNTNYGGSIPPEAQSGVLAVCNTSRDTTSALKSDGTVIQFGDSYLNILSTFRIRATGCKAISRSSWSGLFGLICNNGDVIYLYDILGNNIRMQDIEEAVGIATGNSFGLALEKSGQVKGYQYPEYFVNKGQLNIPSAAKSDVVSVAAGAYHSLALKSDGTVLAWGDNAKGQCDIHGLTNVIAIAASNNNSMALKADGTVVVFGDNTYGQCNVPAGLNLFTGGGSKPGVVNPDISGLWALDSVKDGLAVDSSGNGNNGIISGATLTTGIISNALQFDGIDDKVTFSYNKPENNFTLEAWVKPTETHQRDVQSNTGTAGTAGQKYIFGANQEGANGGIGVSVGTNGISVYEHGDGYLPALAVYNGDIGTDWVHVVVVVENQTPKIYVNGVLKHTGLKSTRPKSLAPTTLGYGSYGAFKGRIDEAALYNKVLTAAEIEQKYKKIVFLDKITLTNQYNDEATARCTFGTHLNKLEFELHKPVNELTLALDFPSNMGIGCVEEIIFNNTDSVSVPVSAATVLEGHTIKLTHPLNAGKYTLKLLLTINQELIVQTKAYSDDQGTLINNDSGRFEFEFMDFKDLPDVI